MAVLRESDKYLYLTRSDKSKTELEASCILPTKLDLTKNEYEISLIEIQTSGQWLNVYDCSILFWDIGKSDDKRTINFPSGYYKNFDEFIKMTARITSLVEHKLHGKLANKYFSFFKNKAGQNSIVLQEKTAIWMSSRLKNIVRQQNAYIANIDDDEEKRIPIFPDIYLDQYSIIATCNVVPPSSVGTYSSNILRVFSTQRGLGNEVFVSNIDPIYVPVCTNILDKITVRLTDMKGNPLKFGFEVNGEVVLLLHLRNKNKMMN